LEAKDAKDAKASSVSDDAQEQQANTPHLAMNPEPGRNLNGKNGNNNSNNNPAAAVHGRN